MYFRETLQKIKERNGLHEEKKKLNESAIGAPAEALDVRHLLLSKRHPHPQRLQLIMHRHQERCSKVPRQTSRGDCHCGSSASISWVDSCHSTPPHHAPRQFNSLGSRW
jgi:hypothetical protein